MKKVIYVFVVILMFIFFMGCTDDSEYESIGNEKYTKIIKINDYGNGVIYFDDTGSKFGSSLSSWIIRNPNKTIVSITSEDMGVYGTTSGYWVVYR